LQDVLDVLLFRLEVAAAVALKYLLENVDAEEGLDLVLALCEVDPFV
jgi:hypothetical protein